MSRSMNRIVFIADFFSDQVPGGGELNNEELINILRGSGCKVEKKNCHFVDKDYIRKNSNSWFIVSNFVNLSEEVKLLLQDEKYVIYEHDHKYLKSRNPALYENYHAPPSEIINFDFYKSAMAVVCQSKFHEEIVKKNLKLNNITNIGGNLWSSDILNFLEKICKKEKKNVYSIMNSSISHKNTSDAVRYCKYNNFEYELIPALQYRDFLERLGANKFLIFLPKTPETLSRIAVEARMMGMSVITNKNLGASKEEWFSLKGLELINVMRSKRSDIPKKILDAFK